MSRQCGDCQLCCKLIPVRSINKPAGARCRHQRVGKGCTIYPSRPLDCMAWSCRWLQNEAGGTGRPDRVHYVIDIMPDYVTLRDDQTGAAFDMECVQIWIDPDYPDAHRDPFLRAWLHELARKRPVIGLVRFNTQDAVAIAPPPVTDDGRWHEKAASSSAHTHSLEEIRRALAGIGGAP